MRKKNLGQSAVEYLLLLVVISSIMVAVLNQVKAYMLDGADNCGPDSQSLVCLYGRFFGSVGSDGNNFRYFSIMR